MRSILIAIMIVVFIGVAVLAYNNSRPTINTPTGTLNLNISPFADQQTCLRACADTYCVNGQCTLGTGIEECEQFCER